MLRSTNMGDKQISLLKIKTKTIPKCLKTSWAFSTKTAKVQLLAEDDTNQGRDSPMGLLAPLTTAPAGKVLLNHYH